MLTPDNRRHLLDILRPPAGYALDYAIGTTYSLDLLALLTAPLAFTMLRWEEETDVVDADPIALLESIRRHANRLTVFCQAGRIQAPKASQLLFGYLESCVVEVTPRVKDRAFHPKVWALRFRPEGGDAPVRYRLLCLSRNLTFDRSWDTALVLDGELSDRKRGYGQNRPLGEFLSTLPALAIHPLAEEVTARVLEMGDEIRRVRFQPPAGFQELSFHPLGLKRGRQLPFGKKANRMLMISPFISEGLLTELSQLADQSILVSRLESLQDVDQAALTSFDEVYVLDEAANVEPTDPDTPADDTQYETGTDDTVDENVTDQQNLLGLHAKLYALDRGWYTEVWTGSANATNAAFFGNVEFLVRLYGKKSRCGVQSILGESSETGLRKLLTPYRYGSGPEPDPIAKRLEDAISSARRALVSARIRGRVDQGDSEDRFDVTLTHLEALDLPASVRVTSWPITLRSETASKSIDVDPRSDVLASYSNLSFEALTSFFAFEVVAIAEEKTLRSRFVLNLPLLGLPEQRNERLLQAMLQNKDQVLRLILLLLWEGGTDVPAMLAALHGDPKPWEVGTDGALGIPLFEVMMRSLDRNPPRLDAVATLIEQLKKTEDGRRLLPDQLDAIWQPIWAARKKLRNE